MVTRCPVPVLVDHARFQLEDYPILAWLAQARTAPTCLNGRACRYLYEGGLVQIDHTKISEREMALIRKLGVELPDD